MLRPVFEVWVEVWGALWVTLCAALLVAGPTLAQGVTFTPKRPMFRIAVHDLPGLLAAAEQTAIGKLLADPEVAEAWAFAEKRYEQQTTDWAELIDALHRHSPHSLTFGERAEFAFRKISWRDIHSFDLSASFAGEDPGDDVAGIDLARGFVQPAFTITLHPVPAAGQRVLERFDAFVADLRKNAPPGVQLAPDQKVAGHPGLVLELGGNLAPELDGIMFGGPGVQPIWLTKRPGLFVGGNGTHDLGTFHVRKPGPPSFVLGVDLARYVRMIASITSNVAINEFLEATGFLNAGMFEWRLTCDGDRVVDELSLAFAGEVGGVIGALLSGMAPLPDQPLPENALLQVRCAFDVAALVAAIDRMLAFNDIRTLTEQGMLEDLRRAWTGGATFGLTAPAPGALVPRVYASFGIVDDEALGRLLARMAADPNFETKTREREGVECTFVEIDGFPSALQPAWCMLDNTIHFAESAGSLRALLKARANDAPRVLDVGDAPRPPGEGLLMPNFELRFDGAAIHAAMQEVWMPLMAMSMAAMDSDPFVQMDEMPEVETVTKHLLPGRGVLRRTKDGIVLSMSGALGGPETQALAAMYGPIVTATLSQTRQLELDSIRSRLISGRMHAVHGAIEAYTKREGKRPESLGAMLTAGDLDAATLLVTGDKLAEPVMHDGKQIATTSFRYYPEGLTVRPSGEEVQAVLIAIPKNSYWRNAIDQNGVVHQGWGDFADKSLDELEKAARKK